MSIFCASRQGPNNIVCADSIMHRRISRNMVLVLNRGYFTDVSFRLIILTARQTVNTCTNLRYNFMNFTVSPGRFKVDSMLCQGNSPEDVRLFCCAKCIGSSAASFERQLLLSVVMQNISETKRFMGSRPIGSL